MTAFLERAGATVDRWVAEHEAQLVTVRRHLHAHPELAFAEHETTAFVEHRLRAAGLAPRRLPAGTGLVVDIGPGPGAGPMVVLRGDIDALPLADLKDVPYASTVDGRCHACGHDVHTTAVLGAALALAEVGDLPGTVRCVSQPAEETVPGGATHVVATGVLQGATRAFALHCDPSIPVGTVGLRTGPITAACDRLDVVLTGPGGHTARPQRTVDVVYALGRLITDLPGMLSRRVDPRSGMSVVWGAVEAGRAGNAIPQRGRLRGTLRVLDRDAWATSEELVRELIDQIVAPTGARVQLDHVRGVPPTVNDPRTVELLRSAALDVVGADGIGPTAQSMGGEDFGWFAEVLPIALVRLGTHAGDRGGPALDLHQGTFDVDESAIGIGTRLLARAALHALVADAGVTADVDGDVAGDPPEERSARPGAPAPEERR